MCVFCLTSPPPAISASTGMSMAAPHLTRLHSGIFCFCCAQVSHAFTGVLDSLVECGHIFLLLTLGIEQSRCIFSHESPRTAFASVTEAKWLLKPTWLWASRS